MPEHLSYRILRTTLGDFFIAGSEEGLLVVRALDENLTAKEKAELEFPKLTKLKPNQASKDVLNKAVESVRAYFSGISSSFSSLPCSPIGTDFQKSVWLELRRIPPGETISYSELAQRISAPKATRAVAAACGSNPLLIIVPCHRVIAKDGSLGGFSAGLAKKRLLLEHELRAFC